MSSLKGDRLDDYNEKFVWKKKEKLDKKRKIKSGDDAARKQQKKLELEQIEKRRLERQERVKEREKQRDLERFERDKEQTGDWVSREARFQLDQAKKRAQIRIREGREQPIDILMVNLAIFRNTISAKDVEVEGLEIDTESPCRALKFLSLARLEHLQSDLELFAKLEDDSYSQEFWNALLIVAKDELLLRGVGPKNLQIDAGRRQEIELILADKSVSELLTLQDQVKDRLKSASSTESERYWLDLAYLATVFINRITVDSMHSEIVSDRTTRESKQRRPLSLSKNTESVQKQVERIQKRIVSELDSFETLLTERSPSISSRSLSLDEIELVIEGLCTKAASVVPAVSLHDFKAELHEMRMAQLSGKGSAYTLRRSDIPESASNDEILETAFKKHYALEESRKAAASLSQFDGGSKAPAHADTDYNSDTEEQMFANEVAIPQTHASSNLQLRKPRYFNKVLTTFEWNQYNRTHFDKDNPPAKIINGYQFNIFYPDLMDKALTPTFKIERDEGWPDTAVMRFSAGPPYEDIAFRIVNREWDKGRGKGYSCVFERGTLQLYFRFKRHIYRR